MHEDRSAHMILDPQSGTLNIVIIGLGVGGLYASKSALAFNPKCHVTIIEKRSFDQFSPCGLPFVIEGIVRDFEELKYAVPEFSKKLTKLLQHEVISIDREKRVVRLLDLSSATEKEIGYDSLIIATGASPVILPVPGAEEFLGRGVYCVSDIDNSADLLRAARSSSGQRAVIVGGGAIGLEIAVALKKLGVDVAVTKRTPHPFPRNLDPQMGKPIVEHLEDMGIRVLFGKGIEGIEGQGSVESVLIAGERIACQIVVMAAGMKGNTGLAEQAGAACENGFVKVDNRMETSAKGVYAVGDLVRTYSRIDGTPATMQLATAAYRQGIAAGVNAAGGDTPYPGALNTFLTCVGGLEIASTGYNLETAKGLGYDAKAISSIREVRPHYMPDAVGLNLRVICDARDGKILGAQAVGKEGAAWRINLFSLAIHGGMTLHDIMDAELAYSPPFSQMYDPIAQIAEIGLKRLKLRPRRCKKVCLPENRL